MLGLTHFSMLTTFCRDPKVPPAKFAPSLWRCEIVCGRVVGERESPTEVRPRRGRNIPTIAEFGGQLCFVYRSAPACLGGMRPCEVRPNYLLMASVAFSLVERQCGLRLPPPSVGRPRQPGTGMSPP